MSDLPIHIETDARLEKIAGSGISLTPEQVAVVKNTVAKGTTDLELAYFLNVCNSVQLNPFLKEIWCYKDGKGNLLVFAGRDGFLAKAQKNPAFAGIRSSEVCQNDEFSIDIPNKQINHKITSLENRGDIIGAYAIVYRKEGEPTIELVDFKTYNKGWNVWESDPVSMIKKVAEQHALKKAMGISGLQIEENFNIRDGIALPRNLAPDNSLLEEIKYARKDIPKEGVNCISDEMFLKIVCKAEFGSGMAVSIGQKMHIKKVLFEENKYDWTTAIPIKKISAAEPAQPQQTDFLDGADVGK